MEEDKKINFKVEILKHPTEEDLVLCKKSTLVKVGKDSNKVPTEEWKRKILAAEHSPIRTLQFVFRITNIPYWVSVHLCRHVMATPFVKTQRNDRQSGYDRGEAPQNQPVDMCWAMNAQELMNIARKRLCTQASIETRAVVMEICKQVESVNPEFTGLLVSQCVYKNGKCDEFYPCGCAEAYLNANKRKIKKYEENRSQQK